ncbi:DNA-binding protein [Kocuria coralli]|uniref:DNA-binding protein n=1 Tax=Kocuria coralli TaxID=1461025 RepID=A0A5J5KYZ9_9MICC|nr:DNA-binding protein [Kocuria coralli]KAA9394125.1 DNA-binding protein [Kocuria coralli]
MTSENIEQQIQLYGQPLSERFGAVVNAYSITQRRLAEVLGLSAPMLSQLNSGRRIKIGNPAVYERLVMLEQRVGTTDIDATLNAVEQSQPVLTTTQIQAGIHGETNAVSALASVIPAPELRHAVDALGESAPTLVKVLGLALQDSENHGNGVN